MTIVPVYSCDNGHGKSGAQVWENVTERKMSWSLDTINGINVSNIDLNYVFCQFNKRWCDLKESQLRVGLWMVNVNQVLSSSSAADSFTWRKPVRNTLLSIIENALKEFNVY